MELIKLNNISCYKFGLVSVEKKETLIQCRDKIYMLTEDDEIDLITIKSSEDSVFDINDDLEVELESNKLYYLKCKKFYNSPEFTIKKYKKLTNYINAKLEINQFKFSKERFYDIFSSYIENKNVLLSYWIFPHININKFLRNIRIPYKLIFEKDKSFYQLRGLSLEKTDLRTNSILFSNLKNIDRKIQTVSPSFHSSVDGGFAKYNIAYKEIEELHAYTEKCCFVIFNPHLSAKKILDLKDLSIIFPVNETTNKTFTIES